MQGSDAQATKAISISSTMTKLDFLYAMKWSAGDESPSPSDNEAAYRKSGKSECVDKEMPDYPLKPFRMRSDPAVVHYGYQHAGIADLL